MADLRDYTSLRVGGPAKKFVEVGTEPEIIAAIEAAGDSPILIIGGGTNILVADSGFEGTVIRIVNNSLQAEVDACSGATLTIGFAKSRRDAKCKVPLSINIFILSVAPVPALVCLAPNKNSVVA